jgi:integrase
MSRSARLSAAKVRQVLEAGKYYDGNGLFLRVEPTGSKRWVQRLTIHGKQREIGLGAADLVTLAEARDAAIENRKLARAGGDPLAAKRNRVAVPTFDEAVQKVIELYSPTWRNAKHAAQFRNTLSTYAGPIIGAKPVSEVTSADVLRVLTPIWTSKAETARRVKQRIGTVMKWAVAAGHRNDDPCAALTQALPKSGQKVEHRKSLPYQEVAGCIATINESAAALSTKLALEFLILTAARSGEVRGVTWDEIDLDGKVWHIPGERMKGKVEHIVPLSSRAIEVLITARQLGSAGLLFPGIKGGKQLSDMTLSKLVKELGYPCDVHGFRTSFRTWVQEKTNTPFEVAERALAHKTRNAVVAAYARSDLMEKRRQLMQRWADYLGAAEGKVIKIGGAA